MAKKKLKGLCSKKNNEFPDKGRLIGADTHFTIVEAYKRMRTNLLFMLGRDKKVIAFTSTMANEGKTTNCSNLGIAFAQAGNKTLIIDMDMRKPQIHNYFSVKVSPGLSEVLAGLSEEPNIIKTSYENLFVLPAGTTPPSPPELIMSERFLELIEELKAEFDYIFIDTPPVHLVTDLAVVAGKLDGVVFVVREKTVPIELLKKSAASIERVGGKILGFVLNDSGQASSYLQYRYRRKYAKKYGYGYFNEEE